MKVNGTVEVEGLDILRFDNRLMGGYGENSIKLGAILDAINVRERI